MQEGVLIFSRSPGQVKFNNVSAQRLFVDEESSSSADGSWEYHKKIEVADLEKARFMPSMMTIEN